MIVVRKGLIEHETSASFDGERRVPINRQAAIVFYKAPWWARVPEAGKKAIIEASGFLKPEELADISKQPPPWSVDRRGTAIIFKNGEAGIVTGFSHFRALIRKRQPSENAKPCWWIGNDWDWRRPNKINETISYWWVCRSGNYQVIRWMQPTQRSWRVLE